MSCSLTPTRSAKSMTTRRSKESTSPIQNPKKRKRKGGVQKRKRQSESRNNLNRRVKTSSKRFRDGVKWPSAHFECHILLENTSLCVCCKLGNLIRFFVFVASRGRGPVIRRWVPRHTAVPNRRRASQYLRIVAFVKLVEVKSKS